MQHIKTLASPSPTRSTEKAKPQLSANWVDALFAKLQAIFLSRWTGQFKTEAQVDMAKQEWAQGLSGLSGDQVGRALSYCREHLDWPPSIAEFRRAALGSIDGWQYQGEAYRIVNTERLTRKMTDEDRAKGRESLAALRRGICA